MLEPSLKNGRRRRGLRCCCGTAIVFLVLLVIASGAFLLAELLSRPGFDKNNQDTQSNLTRQKLQTTRGIMTGIISRIKSANETLSKQELVDYIQLSTAYSSAAYTVASTPQNCNNPAWSTLTDTLSSSTANGFVARDDVAQIIVVAFKGISSTRNFITGLNTRFVAMDIVNGSAIRDEAQVQAGVQDSYRTIESTLFVAVDREQSRFANYSILVTGHNLGGSQAVLASLALKARYPGTTVLCVTQGEGKAFNQAGADFIDREFPRTGYGMIRAVHGLDGIPTASAPYVNKDAVHHGGEVWQFKDPLVPDSVIICRGQGDPECSSSAPAPFVQFFLPALPWSAEALHYFDIELNSAQSAQCGGPGGQWQYALLTSRGVPKTTPSSNLVANVMRQ
ncbi:Probable triacylglycerol lipase [Taphrina deformans PYCC 5710]|uniref:Probable triacylglycerol lipase n=1 Tax=Taphrina deformans (strain PYCC 5710 / ATCC 11124 / CBS 356.35 / IMI 108563 / JCM 9778 / NBRC 8474) TaxID=1097556 RepID=R4XGY4_TAPDE|nr:Probable triacylglycerol lipase [Taphrina deformans PYCC 5710]|eukprot:CCG82616.2 Probable triacylglycerol lipase [Taphrina deformans PYCC 5710]